MTKRVVPYTIVDVFTSERFSGNPLAVIRDASLLSSTEMQSIAGEFGFSETTFVLPPADADSTARVRIFTPSAEIPFAGHPNIGTAFAIAVDRKGAKPPSDSLVFEELGGIVQVEIERENGLATGARITAPQSLQILGRCDMATVARCLGHPASKLVTSRIYPCVATVGLPFAFAELTDRIALAAIEIDISAFREAAKCGHRTVDGFALCAFVLEDEFDNVLMVRARVFSPLGHPIEDPATGSAAGALASLLAQSRDRGSCHVAIVQGVEMGRPSRIDVRIDAADALPVITGRCVLVSEGSLFL